MSRLMTTAADTRNQQCLTTLLRAHSSKRQGRILSQVSTSAYKAMLKIRELIERARCRQKTSERTLMMKIWYVYNTLTDST
jgi:hypothetical protein